MLVEIIFGLILLTAFIVEVVLTETEKFGWATFLLIVVAAIAVNFFGGALWIKAHVLHTVIFVAVYLAAGVAWSFIKWFSYLVNYRDKWRLALAEDADNKVKWLANQKAILTGAWDEYEKLLSGYNKMLANPLDYQDRYGDRFFPTSKPSAPKDPLPQNDEAWEDYYKTHHSYFHKEARSFKKPQASDNKAKIVAWMAFWVFSLLGTLINDPIRRFFNFIFSSFKKLYQQMSDSLFKDLAPEDDSNRSHKEF